MISKCIYCGKEFESKKYAMYCSNSCYDKSRYRSNALLPKNRCPICDELFAPSRKSQKYCSLKCKKKKRSLNYYHNKTLNGNRQKALERDGYKCAKCGEPENLHVHHKDGSGGKKNENNNLDNLITLCNSCHTKEHYKTGLIAKCLVCGKEFHTTEYKQSVGRGEYCSKECSDKGQNANKPTHNIGQYRTRVYLTCPICGKEYFTTKARLEDSRGKYCSKECGDIAKKNNPNISGRPIRSQIKVQCEVCGKEFVTNKSNLKRGRGKYCGRECYNKARKLA